MNLWNYWQKFEHTGKVEDYLDYIRNRNEECEVPKKEDVGVRQDAGICVCNGNHIETDACR